MTAMAMLAPKDLREAFNRESEAVRLVTLLSPT